MVCQIFDRIKHLFRAYNNIYERMMRKSVQISIHSYRRSRILSKNNRILINRNFRLISTTGLIKKVPFLIMLVLS